MWHHYPQPWETTDALPANASAVTHELLGTETLSQTDILGQRPDVDVSESMTTRSHAWMTSHKRERRHQAVVVILVIAAVIAGRRFVR